MEIKDLAFYSTHHIQLIKDVRELTGAGLKEVKELADTVKEDGGLARLLAERYNSPAKKPQEDEARLPLSMYSKGGEGVLHEDGSLFLDCTDLGIRDSFLILVRAIECRQRESWT